MIRIRGVIILGAASAIAAGAMTASAAAETQPVVQVTGGMIRGSVPAPAGSGAVFKGIPFAMPPVGDFRWREPKPVTSWQGVRDATHYSPACVQNPVGTAVFLSPLAKLYGEAYPQTKIAMSEDCLYLNVWTPEWPVKQTAPVMVWIHGGSNLMGSGAESSYNGTALARKGVVVVTINYRLGALGFFEHPELTRESPHHASGNYGLLDQIAALEWIHQNIVQFGGDPGRVTMFGQSAGSLDIGQLLCSPLARGLFQRAIMESGPVLLSLHTTPLSKGEHFGEQVALSLGLSGAGQIERMRALPTETVIAKVNEVTKRVGDPGGVLDGWFIREPPAHIFAQGRELPVDIMIGNTGHEMSAFRAAAAARGGGSSARSGDSPIQTLKIFYGHSAQLVLAAFLVDNTLGRHDAADSWLNDILGACPGMAMASLQATEGHRSYVYEFDREIPGSGQRALGSFHGLEIPYVFGALHDPTWSWLKFSGVDSKLSAAVQDYWTNFAKTGNPNGPQLPDWRKFDSSGQDAMQFGKTGTISLRSHSGPPYCDLDPADLKQRLNSAN